MKTMPHLARAALICALMGVTTTAMADPPPAVREAEMAMARADREAVRLLMLLDESRRARNVAQITCVDQQLSQVNSIARVLEMRRARVRSAVARGARARVAHERRVIQRVVDQLRHAARAGRACVYAPAGEADRTVVEVTVSPDVQHRELSIPPLRRD